MLASRQKVKTPGQLRDYLAETFGAAADEAWSYYGAAAPEGIPQAMADAMSDSLFSYPVRRIAQEIARRQPKTFRYLFTHAGTHSGNPPVNGNDQTYAFGTGDFDARDRAVSDAMLAAFCNFAATGDPNGPGAPAWTPYDPARDNYVTFGGDFSEGSGWRIAPAAFIERVFTGSSGNGNTPPAP